ncbi:MAG: YafY family transcriptional regulator [Bryobacterales bacterium]|nr:YafY family transcriptional regulator [Bryobacterales bacterium]
MPDPIRPATRLLGALELLQTHGRMTGQELAARLQIGRRTVRRYVAMLEEMGIPVTTGRGPLGGYELVAGFKIPPLIFNDGEVQALALGLAAVRDLGLMGDELAMVTAQAKLERVMPARAKHRVRAIRESVTIERFRETPPGAIPFLVDFSDAAHQGLGVRMGYRSAAGVPSERDFDPYGLAFRDGHWYVVGFCHSRQSVRTFRMDRVARVTTHSRLFVRPQKFDAASHVAHSLATLPRRYSIEVRIDATLGDIAKRVSPALGILEPCGAGVLMRSQADDIDWFARELAGWPWRFEVLNPRRLVTAIQRHARLLLQMQGRPAVMRSPNRKAAW